NDASSLDLENGMTLEAWVYPTIAAGVWTTVILKEAPPRNLCYMLQLDPSNRPSVFVMTTGAGLQGALSQDALPLNTWTHLSATYNRTALNLLVNGNIVSTQFLWGTLLTSAGPLRFGGNSIWGEFFVG